MLLMTGSALILNHGDMKLVSHNIGASLLGALVWRGGQYKSESKQGDEEPEFINELLRAKESRNRPCPWDVNKFAEQRAPTVMGNPDRRHDSPFSEDDVVVWPLNEVGLEYDHTRGGMED